MEYTRCRFEIKPMSEVNCDILASMLGEIGFDSFQAEDDAFSAYIQTALMDKHAVEEVVADFPIEDVEIRYEATEMPHADWNAQWEEGFEPVRIGDLAYIHDERHPASSQVRYDIRINPRMAFGSGSHSTTRLMLAQLFGIESEEKRVLDVGCGTGILGIAAMLAGGKHLTALDIDPDSVANTIHNLELNGIEGQEVLTGTIDCLAANDQFDLILANIHLNIHLAQMEQYAAHLQSGGHLLLSGFYPDEAAAIEKAAARHGLRMVQTVEEGGWCAIHFEGM